MSTAVFAFALCCLQPEWELPAPVPNLDKRYECPVTVEEGAFELEMELSLRRLEGTAASVMFGDQLNFGFDSRAGRIFVEGGIIDGVRQLGATRDHLAAGRRFEFRAERNDGVTRFLIAGVEVFRTERLAGRLPHVVVRPHRNVIDLHSMRMAGSITVPRPGATVRRTVVPLLADGRRRTVSSVRLIAEKPRVLVGADVVAASGAGDFRDVRLVAGDGALTRESGSAGLAGRVTVPVGRTDLDLELAVAPGADLRERVDARVSSLTFADGTVWEPVDPGGEPLRLAYRIHERGEFDCHTFRIPAIARANDGALLAVYDMRYNSRRDLQEHIDIGLSRSTDGGRTWADPVPIMDMGEFGGLPQKENGCSDPGILVDRETGEVFVTAVWTHGKPGTHQWRGKGSEPGLEIERTSQFMVVRSGDHGKTWSSPENWTKRLKDPAWHLFAPAPGNGITLRDGTLVMPTQGRDAAGLPFSNITWSRDHGETWTVSTHARSNTTECAVAELADGSLLLSMRDNRNRADKSETNGRAMSRTADLGASWTKHAADHGALPEPVCMASMIGHTLGDGRRILLFSNPNDRHARRRMSIQVSFDGGETWPLARLLDERGGAYSSLVMIDADTVGILYESSQADLVFQAVPLAEFVED